MPDENFLYVFKGARYAAAGGGPPLRARRRPPAPARRACGLSRPVPPRRADRPPGLMRRRLTDGELRT
ncbi:hypothetical protein GCM10009727_28530 [Actinomadura napierensis]|uniref:Uncharacterized protein n=1 Tax=Actinomadura napierensis TaxID=267854 RepID=A0ABP5KMB3_9ACTN